MVIWEKFAMIYFCQKHGIYTVRMCDKIDPFTAKDAIWRPHGIIQLRICLSARYNFYYAFQQPVR